MVKPEHHEPSETAQHTCHHEGEQPMCTCDHNPGGECHCPPNECKCDQKHHLVGETQHGHAEHSEHQASAHGEHSAHAGHEQHMGHAGHDGHDHSHHDPKKFRNQFWVALVLTIPTLLYSMMLQHLFGFSMPAFVGSEYLPAVLGTIILATGGRVFLVSGFKELKAKKPGMMALIGMALVVAFGYSVYLTIAQALGFAQMGMDFWWELAALVAIMLLGHWIEMASIAKAQNAMGALAKLLPDTAIVLRGNTEREVLVSELQVGDRIIVKAGATIPVDGVVYRGSSSVDESMLTGESRAVAKAKGDKVIAGTRNASAASVSITDEELGALRIEVTAVGSATLLSGIVKLVTEAQKSKSSTQRLADRAAGWLFYAALAAALVTAVLWSLIPFVSSAFVVERMVTVLVIACPHALGLAIPLVSAITGSIAAGKGVLIRDRLAFEKLRKADVVIFDKTGTLTTAERSVTELRLAQGSPLKDTKELLALAAGLEKDSSHPLAIAIVNAAKNAKLRLSPIRDAMAIPGVGIAGRLQDARIQAGGPALLIRSKVNLQVSDLVAADSWGTAGETTVFVVRNQQLLGLIAIGDTIREDAKDAVRQLKLMGKRVVMLSGDSHGVANSVASQLGIDEVYAEVLPADKNAVVAKLQAEKQTVVMVGDGVNDAPALALADVGFAIGSGTDVAIESADVVLINQNVMAVPQAIRLAKKSYRTMVQNLWWAAGYNILAIPLAAGAFMSFGLVLTPALGAVLMSLSTIIVALNALNLRREARR